VEHSFQDSGIWPINFNTIKHFLHHTDDDERTGLNWVEVDGEGGKDNETTTATFSPTEIKWREEAMKWKEKSFQQELELKKKEKEIESLTQKTSPSGKGKIKKENNDGKQTVVDNPEQTDGSYYSPRKQFSTNCCLLTSPDTLKKWKEYDDKNQMEKDLKEKKRSRGKL
jgi:hypothetical protein